MFIVHAGSSGKSYGAVIPTAFVTTLALLLVVFIVVLLTQCYISQKRKKLYDVATNQALVSRYVGWWYSVKSL